MEYGNQFSIIKTFHDWCIENNRMDLDERFDVDLNKCTTSDIGYKSGVKYYFKCPRGIHESELHTISAITSKPDMFVKCKKCISMAQFIIDNFGEDCLLRKWSTKNIKSPWDIAAGSTQKIWLNCDNKDYHVYEQCAGSLKLGLGCPYCNNKKIHPLDSLGALYPEVIDRWSDKNEKSPYEYAPHSSKRIWLKCPYGKHEDYSQTVANAVKYHFNCPRCKYENMGIRKRGENNIFWRGGVCGENDRLRHQSEYKKWRVFVYERDDYTCQCCGKRGDKLNAHHIHSFAFNEELRYDINNGITLCEECHDSTKDGSFHNIYGTMNNTPDQLREYILNKSNIDIYETHPEILSLTTQN